MPTDPISQPDDKAFQVAQLLVQELFQNGSGEEAARLVLTIDTPVHRDLGGWSRLAAQNRITDILREVYANWELK